jgi:hypothetical protein
MRAARSILISRSGKMRRTIRLTGRRQLSRSSVNISLRDVAGKKVLILAIADRVIFKVFPSNARVTVKLIETKQMELVEFGALGNLKAAVDLANQDYNDPSCQLRIASADSARYGVLLGSTKSWRLISDGLQQDGSVRGILNFLPAKIAPRTWKLHIKEDTHPVIEIDDRIPDPRTWAKKDPIFVGTVMPAIIHQIFDDILSQDNPDETDWMNDWLRWAEGLMPGGNPPLKADIRERRIWIDGSVSV